MTRGIDPHPNPPRAIVKAAIALVAEQTGIAEGDICGHSTKRAVADARKLVWLNLKSQGYGASAISRSWGCDVSTVQVAFKPRPKRPAVNDLGASATTAHRLLNCGENCVSIGRLGSETTYPQDMTRTQRRLLANRAIGQCMVEMAQAEPQMPIGDAAYLLAREAALQLLTYRGAEKASEALYQLADEIVGVRS